MKKLINKENGWIITSNKRYAFYITESGMTIGKKEFLSNEYDMVTISDLDVIKEAIKLYEDVLNANYKLNSQEKNAGDGEGSVVRFHPASLDTLNAKDGCKRKIIVMNCPNWVCGEDNNLCKECGGDFALAVKEEQNE